VASFEYFDAEIAHFVAASASSLTSEIEEYRLVDLLELRVQFALAHEDLPR
jgi:hypothetical protein